MSAARFVRSTSFRLIAWYVTIFVVSVASLFFIVYWITIAALDQQLRDSVERESLVLIELYRSGGIERLSRGIQLRAQDLRTPRRYYLLQNEAGERVAGNLPPMEPLQGETVLPASSIATSRRASKDDRAESYPIVAHGHVLDKGEFLLVGENRYRAVKTQEAIVHAFGWAIAIALLFAGGGGAALRAGFLRRVDEVNRTARSIMEGDLSKRVPTRGTGDEMDQLAVNLNTMLDRMQLLMESLKQVTDDVAHDLRTPLSRLRQRLEAARPSGHPVIEQSIAELDTILETFSALLRIGQIESGARRAAFSKVDVAQIVTTVAEAYAPVAEDNGQKLQAIVRPAHTIRGDRELLTQMVANLIENSIRHCPSGVSITIELEEEGGTLVLRAVDTGPGIPAAERKKVFRRFYRLDTSRTTPGSGLGLALVKAIADLHHASIELGDNRPGLRVTVRFQAAGDAAGALAARKVTSGLPEP